MTIYEPLVVTKKTNAKANRDPNTNISLRGNKTMAPK